MITSLFLFKKSLKPDILQYSIKAVKFVFITDCLVKLNIVFLGWMHGIAWHGMAWHIIWHYTLSCIFYNWFGITASTIYEPANSPLLHLESDHQYSIIFPPIAFREQESSSPSSSKVNEGDITRTKNCCDAAILDSKRISDREWPTKYLLQEDDVILTWEKSDIEYILKKGQCVERVPMLGSTSRYHVPIWPWPHHFSKVSRVAGLFLVCWGCEFIDCCHVVILERRELPFNNFPRRGGWT